MTPADVFDIIYIEAKQHVGYRNDMGIFISNLDEQLRGEHHTEDEGLVPITSEQDIYDMIAMNEEGD